jgi:signal transduction histidine kinase
VPADISKRLTRIDGQLDSLTELRKSVVGGTVTLTAAITNYRVLIGDLIGMRESTAELAGDERLATNMRAAAALSSMKESASIERVVVLNILAQHAVTPALYREFVGASNGREDGQRRFDSFSEQWQRDLYSDTVTGPDLREASKFEGDISAIGIGALEDNIFTSSQWDSAIAGVANLLRKVEIQLDAQVIRDASTQLDALQRRVLLQTGLLLGMLLLAILFAWIVARSMARSLRELRHGALTVAQYGLPQAVARLRDPTLATQMSPHQLALQIAEPLPVRSRDEFGQVAEAFNAVHLEAVRTAAEQAALRASVASMFVNLARRSQILVDRLIGHLDRLERGEEDPDRLAELFQLDHLATRMRRNDENLLVLAGADSTRIQREPAPFMDVLRAAQSEVEHYTRIEFGMIDRDIEIAAHAVNDMVHLVAELLDNATAFSPPDSAVVVEARRVGDRAVMLVEDRGIGISPDQLADLNERLANPPMVDAAVSRMMGLVVVARLAARHGVKVELRPARERGTVADLTLPAGVLVPRASGGRSIAGMPSAGARDAVGSGAREAVTAGPASFERPPVAAPLALESGRPGQPSDFGAPALPGRPTPVHAGGELAPSTGAGVGFSAAAAAFGSGAFGGDHQPALNGKGNGNGPATPGARGLPAWSDLTGVNGADTGPGRPAISPPTDPLPQRRSTDRWTLDGEAIESGDAQDPSGFVPRQRMEPGPAVPPAGAPQAGQPMSAPFLPARPGSASASPAGPTPAGPSNSAYAAFGPRPTSAPTSRPQEPAPQARTQQSAAPQSAPPAATRPAIPPSSAPSRPGTPPSGVVPGSAQPPVWPPVSSPPGGRPSQGPPAGRDDAGSPPARPAQPDHTAEIPRVRLDWEPDSEEADGPQSRETHQRFADQTMELPIFRELESAWFRAQPPPSASAPTSAKGPASTSSREPAPDGGGAAAPNRVSPDQAPAGPRPIPKFDLPVRPTAPASAGAGRPAERSVWATAADEGWQAAAALADEHEFVTTETGLPKRVPMSQLVPGGVEKSATSAHRRTPESVRGLLAAYHRGVQRGRTQQPKAGESKTPEPTTAGTQNSQGGKEQER